MWANYSRDQSLIKALTTGDVHSNIGSQLLQKPADQITKEERVFVKGVVFGLMFGRGSASLASGLGETLGRVVPDYEAQRFIRLFFNMFPVASEWLITQEKFAMENGYIRNLFGRVRRLPEVRATNEPGLMAEARRNARNSPIQSLASDVTNLALIRIRDAFVREGLRARLLLQVHDQIVAEAPEDEIDAAMDVMKEQMLVPPAGITVPLAIEIKSIDRWGGESIKEIKAQWQT
jgi:DNA polymerase-1